MPNPWFRMYTDFLEDPKMLGLAFEDQRHFIGVLALKCTGALDQECGAQVMDRLVAQRLWIDHSAINEVKRRLIEAGLVDSYWQPMAWSKRQRHSDHDPSGAERQRRHREKERNALHNGAGNATVTPPEEKRIEEKRIDGQKPKSRFQPPSVEQVSEYCRERGNCVDPEQFVDSYTSKGWKIGATPMKDWRAAVRTWEHRDKTTTAQAKVSLPTGNNHAARFELSRLCMEAGMKLDASTTNDQMRSLLRQKGLGQ